MDQASADGKVVWFFLLSLHFDDDFKNFVSPFNVSNMSHGDFQHVTQQTWILTLLENLSDSIGSS